MKKAVFLFVLFVLPLLWLVTGDRLIKDFVTWVYLPVGSVYSIYIWRRPYKEMMFYVTFAPLVLFISSFLIVNVNCLLSEGTCKFSFSDLFGQIFIGGVFFLFLGFFHVLLCFGVFQMFKYLEWFD